VNTLYRHSNKVSFM